MKEKKSKLPFVLIGLVLVLVGLGIWLGSGGSEKAANSPATPTGTQLPQTSSQRIEGQLTFIKRADASKIKQIAIEIADTPEERNRGLMDRRSLPDSTGMLFIFERSGQQSFWMKNTYIPLDIIFVNANKEIVKIHKYAAPHSIDSYPSEKEALYVVEVVGGFTDQHTIQEGDQISFNLTHGPS
ncbi:DUF192 domain-containing protein [Rhodocytophaga aerolata]|uniref:DUF192 domain-containing protein n=1 Tax=Rhodocytophaga aerolata TaxID=455078 RepID=A0ABT8RAF8_9BACT|nr:DUF192 domain-containing protein [Rhodocytophaga aerolata]MDO1447747.1 DUF192 domain-containing protein [Rhodocytophaga aerolata]